MAGANKCDRCGVYYEQSKYKKNDIAWIRTIDKYNSTLKNYDLCPKCSEELDEWLKRGNKDE